jgi:CRP-like cAMP-binding protein
MDKKDIAYILDTLRLHMTFKDLSDNILMELVTLLWRQSVKKGEFIFHQGDPSDHMHIVESGRVILSKNTASGKSIIPYIAVRGTTLNAVTCIKPRPRFFSALAMENTTLLISSSKDFVRWVSSNPEVASNIIDTMGEMQNGTFNRILDLIDESVEQRVLNALANLGSRHGTELSITNMELAELIGSSREAAARVVSRLKKKGLLIKTPGQLTILDLPKLNELAQGRFLII